LTIILRLLPTESITADDDGSRLLLNPLSSCLAVLPQYPILVTALPLTLKQLSLSCSSSFSSMPTPYPSVLLPTPVSLSSSSSSNPTIATRHPQPPTDLFSSSKPNPFSRHLFPPNGEDDIPMGYTPPPSPPGLSQGRGVPLPMTERSRSQEAHPPVQPPDGFTRSVSSFPFLLSIRSSLLHFRLT
jgi:hypothetical protein